MAATWRSILAAEWRASLPAGSRCALALYPDHWNAGDAAIWWATRTLLAELGVAVDYACDPWSYAPGGLRAAVPEGPILILGGGNFGDVYPREQSLRTRILADFPDRPIVQLPQSIAFRSPAAVAETAALLARQRACTLLLRDAASLAFAREQFPGTAARLCPDTALALDLPAVPRAATVPVVALWRHDGESCGPLPALPAGWVERDWTVPGGILPAEEARELSTAARSFKEWVGMPPPWPPPEAEPCPLRRRIAWRHLPWAWDQLAEDRALRGLRILARGRVVLTNRLHAHLLCLLAGIPHVVCDTANGKLFAHRDTWFTAPSPGPPPRVAVRFAATPAEAVDLAAGLLAEERP
ncbi:MAG: polysaccharide pyruvyl transferase family protein [Planctomycetes bacterium]|nr:polysaccharide pyruvyl transferase family protein [Planctomycetota bacterium]